MTSQTLNTSVDNQYLVRLKQGDQQAWMQLLHEWQGPLYQYLCYALPDAEQAQRALSETMDAVIRSIPQYDGNMSLSAFFYSLATQRVSTYYRRRNRSQRSSRNGVVGGGFKAILHTLPQRYRQALLLRYHLGLSVTEVAQILNRTPQETETLLAQGSRQLQDAMGSAGLQ